MPLESVRAVTMTTPLLSKRVTVTPGKTLFDSSFTEPEIEPNGAGVGSDVGATVGPGVGESVGEGVKSLSTKFAMAFWPGAIVTGMLPLGGVKLM